MSRMRWERRPGWAIDRYRAGQCRRCASLRMADGALCVGCDEKAWIYRQTRRVSTGRVMGRPRVSRPARVPRVIVAPVPVPPEPMREPQPFVAHPVRYQVYLAPVGSYARQLVWNVFPAVR